MKGVLSAITAKFLFVSWILIEWVLGVYEKYVGRRPIVPCETLVRIASSPERKER